MFTGPVLSTRVEEEKEEEEEEEGCCSSVRMYSQVTLQGLSQHDSLPIRADLVSVTANQRAGSAPSSHPGVPHGRPPRQSPFRIPMSRVTNIRGTGMAVVTVTVMKLVVIMIEVLVVMVM
ncbi:hypothetical protein E2C01_068769 [Portunus trituberculatus]|uniref:Uncharacterized protein n=1 Tax=Portunus trituberculatus TaxID=210409 RepID=A0A5B7HPP0_PORTR|nr:hypothetical protein [Portunus trituberculatus]